MPSQIVMDHTGDTRHDFNAADAEAVKAAEERFRELTGQGFLAATRAAPGENPRVVRRFDPTALETLFFPPLIGG